jgi:hypothetical protein
MASILSLPKTSSAAAFLEQFGEECSCYSYQGRVKVETRRERFTSYNLPAGHKLFISEHINLVPALYLLRSELEVMMDWESNPDSVDNKFFHVSDKILSRFIRTCLLWPKEKFVKFTKYHTAFPMAYYLWKIDPFLPYDDLIVENPDQTYFPNTFDALIWTGWVRTYMRNRLISHHRSSVITLFWSLIQGVKRGCRIVDESFVRSTYLSHAKILSSPPPHELMFDHDTIQQREAKKIFYETLFYQDQDQLSDFHDQMDNQLVFEPSPAASVENQRRHGGQRAFIRNLLLRREFPDSQISEESLPTVTEPQLYSMTELRPGVISEAKSSSAPFSRFIGWDPPWSPLLHSDAELDSDDENFTDQPEYDYANVAAVLEPLKVRTITAMPAILTNRARPLQKKMHSLLKRFPQFVLISRPLAPTDFLDLLDREKKCFSSTEGFRWASGDFSSATDRLDIRVTKEVFLEFSTFLFLTDDERQNLKRLLWPVQLSYPDPGGLLANLFEESGIPHSYHDLKHVDVLQQNGQLMGSVLSFPILCVINLLCYYRALNSYLGKIVPVIDLPVLINGDDICFRCDSRLYDLWKEETSSAGFKLSLGKNYLNSHFVTINSELYDTRTFHRHEFFNVGLLIGQSKLGSKKKLTDGSELSVRQHAMDKPLNSQFDEVIRGAHDPERARKRFLHYHILQIKEDTRFGLINLFLPSLYGGLNFQPTPYIVRNPREFVTLHQLKMAYRQYTRITSFRDPHPLSVIERSVDPYVVSYVRKSLRRSVNFSAYQPHQAWARFVHAQDVPQFGTKPFSSTKSPLLFEDEVEFEEDYVVRGPPSRLFRNDRLSILPHDSFDCFTCDYQLRKTIGNPRVSFLWLQRCDPSGRVQLEWSIDPSDFQINYPLRVPVHQSGGDTLPESSR